MISNHECLSLKKIYLRGIFYLYFFYVLAERSLECFLDNIKKLCKEEYLPNIVAYDIEVE